MEHAHAHTRQPVRLPRLPARWTDILGTVIGFVIAYAPIVLMGIVAVVVIAGGGR